MYRRPYGAPTLAACEESQAQKGFLAPLSRRHPGLFKMLLLNNQMTSYSRTKKPVKCYIWSITLYGAETWTLRAVD